jgi:hypothetical protein
MSDDRYDELSKRSTDELLAQRRQNEHLWDLADRRDDARGMYSDRQREYVDENKVIERILRERAPGEAGTATAE